MSGVASGLTGSCICSRFCGCWSGWRLPATAADDESVDWDWLLSLSSVLWACECASAISTLKLKNNASITELEKSDVCLKSDRRNERRMAKLEEKRVEGDDHLRRPFFQFSVFRLRWVLGVVHIYRALSITGHVGNVTMKTTARRGSARRTGRLSWNDVLVIVVLLISFWFFGFHQGLGRFEAG